MSQFDNRDIEKILKNAGPRVKPDDEIRNAVYEEVHKAWKQSTQPSWFQKPVFKVAASFALITTLLMTFIFSRSANETLPYITQDLIIQGQVSISKNELYWQSLDKNNQLVAGSSLRTQQNNRLLITLINGNQVRVDENTHLQLVSENELSLQKGRIYVDSNEKSINNDLKISTTSAQINHIGTQYSVAVNDGDLTVNVREGEVLVLDNQSKKSELGIGNSYKKEKSGKVSIEQISQYDTSWAWTQLIPKYFDIQDKSLAEFLQWVSEETGYPVKWQSLSVENRAKNIKLSGSIEGIKPIDSLGVILPTTRFKYTLKDNQIYIYGESL